MRRSAGARSAGALVSRRCASRRRRRPPAVVLRAVVLVFVVAGGGVEVFEGDPLEFLEPLLGVGVPVRVGRRGPREPGPGIFGPARRQQGVGVRVEQGRGPGPGPSVGEFRDLEHDHGGLRPALVSPDPGLDDEQLDLAGPVERGCFRAVHHGQRAIQASQRAFRIGHHRQVRLPAGEPSRRAQLGKGLGPLANAVGGDPGRLTDHADPGREVAGHPRVRVGAFRIRLELGGDQPPAHGVGQVGRQGPQFGPGARLQPVGGRIVRDGRSRAAVGAGALRPTRSWSRVRRAAPVITAGPFRTAVIAAGPATCRTPVRTARTPVKAGGPFGLAAVSSTAVRRRAGTAAPFAPRRTAGAGSAALRTASTGTGAAAPIRPAGTAAPIRPAGTAAPIRPAGTAPGGRHARDGQFPACRHARGGRFPACRHARGGRFPVCRHARGGRLPGLPPRSGRSVPGLPPRSGRSALGLPLCSPRSVPGLPLRPVRSALGRPPPVDRLDADPAAVRGPVAERRRGPGSFPVAGAPKPVVRGRVLRGRSSAEREPAPPSRGPHRVSPRVGAPPAERFPAGRGPPLLPRGPLPVRGPAVRGPAAVRGRGPPPVRAESPPLRRSAPPRRSPPGRASSPVRGRPVLPARRPALRWPP